MLNAFPSLEDLHLNLFEADTLYLLSTLLQPSVKSLTLTISLHGTIDPEFLKLLSKRSPSLKLSLNIDTYDKIEVWMEIFLLFFNSGLALEQLSVPSSFITSNTMQLIGKFSTLRGLHAFGSTMSSCKPEPLTFLHNLEFGYFPSLQSLGLVTRFQKFPAFLDPAVFPQLTRLSISSNQYETVDTVSSCLNMQIRRFVKLEELSLNFKFRDSGSEITEPSFISYKELKSLLYSTKLVRFTIIHNQTIKITDEEIEELASKWPSLKTLKLQAGYSFSGQKLTFASLASLSNHCPGLEELEIPLYPGRTKPFQCTMFRNLSRLTLRLPFESSSIKVAASLQDLVPSFCQVQTARPTGPRDDLAEAWNQLRRHSDHLAQIKRERDVAVFQRDKLIQALEARIHELEK